MTKLSSASGVLLAPTATPSVSYRPSSDLASSSGRCPIPMESRRADSATSRVSLTLAVHDCCTNIEGRPSRSCSTNSAASMKSAASVATDRTTPSAALSVSTLVLSSSSMPRWLISVAATFQAQEAVPFFQDGCWRVTNSATCPISISLDSASHKRANYRQDSTTLIRLGLQFYRRRDVFGFCSDRSSATS